jgi:hypothetical protein
MNDIDPPITPVTDPHGLLSSAEPTATLAQLALMLDVSTSALRIVLKGDASEQVRFIRCRPASESRYAVTDVRAVVEKNRGWLDERRRQAEQLEATQRAAKQAKRAANEAASNARRDRSPPPSRKVPKHSMSHRGPGSERRESSAPEVYVRRVKGA